jgi:hypothetical protein
MILSLPCFAFWHCRSTALNAISCAPGLGFPPDLAPNPDNGIYPESSEKATWHSCLLPKSTVSLLVTLRIALTGLRALQHGDRISTDRGCRISPGYLVVLD